MKIQTNHILNIVVFILLLSFLNVLVAQEIHQRPAKGFRAYQIFFVGNTGAGSSDKLESTLKLLRKKLKIAGSNSAVIFLGDLLPFKGMPDLGDDNRSEAEKRLLQLTDAVKDFKGRIFFIPGEQDWGEKKKVGWKSLVRMEEFLEKTLDGRNVFVPSHGFPGPEHVKLDEKLRLIAINTQWLLTENKKRTGNTGNYIIKEDDEFYVQLEDLIMKHATKDLIIVGHHPLHSNGRYGGHFNPKIHLFPLTLASENAYLPLPFIGTMVYAIRREMGDEQCFCHLRNDWMRYNIDNILQYHERFVYVSAHDCSQQLFKTAEMNRMQRYLISGSAARSEYVAPGHKTFAIKPQFISSEKGFSSINYYTNGSVWIDFWAAGDGGEGGRIQEVMIRGPRLATWEHDSVTDEMVYHDYSDSTIFIATEPDYAAGWLQEFLIGSNNRDAWTTPIHVPYFDIESEHGGLTLVKKGGGQQTITIRLKASDEQQYVLRSVNKDGRRSLPEEFRDTFVAPISQDMQSSPHPFGAFIVPTLAEAAGVYHANPKLVYVPRDPRFGDYEELVGNMLMLYEERPNKDMSGSPSFGNSKDVIGAPELFRKVTNDNDYTVDASALARARLLDMWLSDWDRHKDQWRWASFDAPDGKGKIYKPIPRDRDQAFNRINFFLNPIIKSFLPFQDFRESYGSLKGMGINGRKQDHRFLSVLEKEDWIEIADSVKNALSNGVIESAFRLWPEPVFNRHGEEMIRIGKIRRDKLPNIAEEFYELHARSVDVVGSNKHERFEVLRRDDNQTEVAVFKTSKKGEIREKLYRRLIHGDETDEICLYGLGGNDWFVISGDVRSGTTVYAVGGTGDDSLIDSSSVAGLGKKTRFYDSRKSRILAGPETRIKISDDPRDNDYTQFYEFPQTYPFALAWYTSDDGLVVLGGALRKEHAFRKDPYARQHLVFGSFATSTHALEVNYRGTYRQTFGYYWHLGLNIDFANQNNFRNFYGVGNETKRVGDVDSVRVFLGAFNFEVPFTYEAETGWVMNIVPKAWMTKIDDEQPLVNSMDQAGLSEFTTDPQWYLGTQLFFNFTYWDDMTNPRRGYQWLTTFDGNVGIENAPDSYLTVESEISLYASLFAQQQYTFAIRVGGSQNFGTFPFYTSNALGGTTNLRGYQSTRFSGRSSLYINTDLRLSLFRIGGNILPGTLGVLGFFDVGRVWSDGEISHKWHPGYGCGVWYDIVGELILRFSAGFSTEGNFFLFGPGFFF
jgi:hypothetical protein